MNTEIDRLRKLIASKNRTIAQERRWRHQAETELENLKKELK